MKLFSPLFWGVFLLASGVIILISLLFNKLNLQVGRLIFGMFVLLVGVSLLFSSVGWGNVPFSRDNTVVFSSGENVEVRSNEEYFVIFGSCNYDASRLEPGTRVKINSLFSSCTVKLPQGNVKILASSAFASIHLPDGSISFGTREYGSDSPDRVTVEVTSVFGSATAIK